MKNSFILLFLGVLFFSCGSVKRTQKYIEKGDYDKAIEIAVKKLRKDKTSAKNDEHILLLEEAFKKAVAQDDRDLKFYKHENNPVKYRTTYYLYMGLKKRQDLIRPLLPLYSTTLGKNAKFKMVSYAKKISAAKQEYAAYLYNEGLIFMNLNTTLDYRKAYTSFCELSEIYPNYKNNNDLLKDSHYNGTDFVFVKLHNNTRQVIPYQLEQDLLNFNTYGLDKFWTEYHSQRQSNINYNFGIDLYFESIVFSPERISEKEISREQKIKDGWRYKKDRHGNYILDENDNKIKIDIYSTVTATLFKTEQIKSVFVDGIVVYRDFEKNKNIGQHNLASEFVFENIFASYRGDKRALTNEDLIIINNKFIHFPSNSQMLFDAGEDIKLQLKEILTDNSLR